jgi:hypothetical protein
MLGRSFPVEVRQAIMVLIKRPSPSIPNVAEDLNPQPKCRLQRRSPPTSAAEEAAPARGTIVRPRRTAGGWLSS